MLSWTFLRNLKGKTHKPANSVARKDGNFGGYLPSMTAVRATSLAGIFALAVLTDDDPVEITGFAVS
jgi:hypothetical protein